jgi:hypothetical protein
MAYNEIKAAHQEKECLPMKNPFRRRRAWPDDLSDLIMRLRTGRAEAALANLRAQRAKGDRSAETAALLAIACNFVGRGDEADPLAAEALAAIQERGLPDSSDALDRALCDIVYSAQYGAWIAQGHFDEAAAMLRAHLSSAVQRNSQTAAAAFGFFLAGDDDAVRDLLRQIQPVRDARQVNTLIGAQYLFMVAYMRHVLLDGDWLWELIQRQDQLDRWDEEAARNAANPYGVRLRAILDDVLALLDEQA